MINQNNKTIAICCSTLRELSVLEPMDAICKRANELGFCVQIFSSFEEIAGDMEVYLGEESVFDLINYGKICGIIIFGERIKNVDLINSLIQKANEHNIPAISFDSTFNNCYNITFDYADAFEDVVRHLVEYHKLKKFFVMAGLKNNSFSDERLDVVKKVLNEHGLDLSDNDIAYGQFWETPTKEAMEKFFDEGHELPDAFIAMNDTMATVIVDEVQRHGYKVPEDVVVTGFDGIYLAEYSVPKITTAKQQFDVAGIKAVDIINDCITSNVIENYSTKVPFKMLIRQSCGCHGVDIAGVTANLRDLYSSFETSKRFSKFMDEMTRRMFARTDIYGFITESKGYSHFVDAHDRLLICINKEYLKVDENFYYNEISINSGISYDASKDMIVLVDTGNDSDKSYDMREFTKEDILPDIDEYQRKTKNMLISPIHVGEEIYGHIVMDYKPGDRNAYKTRMYANNLSTVLFAIKQQGMLSNSNRELIQTKNELEKMYITDSMTGIYNRRGFYRRFDEIKKSKTDEIATVISVDLDDLKNINDNYGHHEGDFAIKALGDVLADVVGSEGIYARFGGDEFVAIISNSEIDEDITQTLYEKFVYLLNNKKEVDSKPYQIKCSIGAIQIKWSDLDDIEMVIGNSDKLLYKMKKLHHEGVNDRRRYD